MNKDDFTDPPGRLVTSEMENGNEYIAYEPGSLPPRDVQYQHVIDSLGRAAYAVGSFDTAAQFTNSSLADKMARIREAVHSCAIEDVNTSEHDILLLEAGYEKDVNAVRSARIGLNYAEAIEMGRQRIDEEGLTVDLICDLHAKLYEDVAEWAGEIRTSQNYIGNPHAGVSRARYVPPRPVGLESHLQSMLRYANGEIASDDDPLLRTALVHYQFEAIHPFPDGNGRVGRLLIQLMLYDALDLPCLPVSVFIDKNRRDYYNRLLGVSQNGAWVDWLQYMFAGFEQTAETEQQSRNDFAELSERYQRTVEEHRSPHIAELAEILLESPVIDVETASDRLDVHYNTANRLIDDLVDAGLLREVSGRQRGRVYYCKDAIRAAQLDSRTDLYWNQ